MLKRPQVQTSERSGRIGIFDPDRVAALFEGLRSEKKNVLMGRKRRGDCATRRAAGRRMGDDDGRELSNDRVSRTVMAVKNNYVVIRMGVAN